jgi:transketolase
MDSQKILKKMKRSIIKTSAISKEGHIASAFSILDILWILYNDIMNISPNNITEPDRDMFFLSKGHASLGLYEVLAEKGFFSKEILKNFGKFDSILGGHPHRNKIKGVEASTGSLGHGLPIAVGAAMASKIKGINNKIFVLVGDGECNEGTIWESALLAAHHKLSNLYCIVDYNHSTDRAVQMGNIAKKFDAFGWETTTINGHNHEEILKSIENKNEKQPKLIVANTIKGYGCKIMENNPAWHHKSPNKEELDLLFKELS